MAARQNDDVPTEALTAAAPDSGVHPGMVLKSRYSIERELGSGGFSLVYLARDIELHSKRVVVKVLRDETYKSLWMRKKFRQELEALARIDHPGVVGILDTGEMPDGKPFLVMQFVEGVNLRSMIRNEGMDLGQTGRIVRQVGQALTAAHEKGVHHRDLKPENIMLQTLAEGDLHVMLIDFGIATVKDSPEAGGTEATVVAGTRPYMAPEQLMGEPSASSDIYALGVIAYEMATGKLPFRSDSPAQLHVMQSAGVKVKPRELRPKLPEAAEQVILKALSFDPQRRYLRARDLGDELARAIAAGEEVASTPATVEPGAESTPELETAHVLFMDLVGYSKMAMDRQSGHLKELQDIVRQSPEFRRAQANNRLITLPTGDGMALVFFRDPIAPVQCATEISRALKSRPHLSLRIGIHSGPVYRVSDINATDNVAGGGINLAQRVMDCGDAGHILVSKTVAETVGQLSSWTGFLHDLGETEVKHGVRVHVFNLYGPDAGNPAMPEKLRAAQALGRRKTRRLALGSGAAALVLAVAGIGLYREFGSFAALDSLAILRFANSDPDTQYLSDGMTEDLINNLGQLPHLRVVSRSAVFNTKETDPLAVGHRLGVKAVLMGRLVRQGDDLSVSAELTDARNNNHLWGRHYMRNSSEISAIREDISQEIAQRLLLGLDPGEKKLLAKRDTENPEAKDLYTQGRFWWNKRTQEGFRKAIDLYRQAIAKDANYARAYAGLADCYAAQSGIYPPRQVFPTAKEAALKALEKDDSLGEAHASLAFINFYYDWDWLNTGKEYRKAIQLNPNYPTAHSMYAIYLSVMRRFVEAAAEVKRANQLDVTSTVMTTALGRIYYWAGEYDQAIEQYKKSLEMDPNFTQARMSLGAAYEEKGRYPEAIAELEKAIGSLKTEDASSIGELGRAYALAGKRDETLKAIDRLKRLSEKRYVSPYPFASMYAAMGDKEKALECLEKGYRDRTSPMIYLELDPRFKTLREDARFKNLLKRLNLTV